MSLIVSKKSLSLKYKIIGSFLVFIILTSTIIGFCSYYNAKSNIEKTVGGTAVSIIQSVVSVVDDEKFGKLKKIEDMESEDYKDLQMDLSVIRRATGLKYLYTIRKNEDGKYIYVVDGKSTDEEGFSSLGDEETDVSKAMVESFKGITGYEFSSDDWGNFISAYTPIKDKSGNVVGILGADFDANNMVNQLNKLKFNISIIAIVVIIIGIIAGQVLSTLLVKSLKELKTKAELIKDGDLTVEFNKIGNDEIGVLTQSFYEMVNNLLIITNEIKNNTKNVVHEIDDLYRSFDETSKATNGINQLISEVAVGASKQSNNIDEVSKSMSEVFEQVKKSVNNASLVSNLSDRAMVNTDQAMKIFKSSIEKVITANETVEHTAIIIRELGDKSKEISSFSETISEITEQTNLLALNASIEAARAGEQGRGFAVVADEVKLLAEQSKQASSQIGELASSMQMEIDKAIQSIQNGVVHANEGVSAVKNVGTYLSELEKSNNDTHVKAKEIIDAIILIEEVCKHAVNKIYSLADISRDFSAGSQQAAAANEEQVAIMQQIKENIDNINRTTCCLNDVVNKFKVN